jgi:hypothetical protein
MARRPTEISLTPPRVNLTLYAGDGANLRLVATDLDGEPFDLQGKVWAQIRENRTDEDALVDWDVDDTLAEEGVIVLALTGDDTRRLMDGKVKFSGAWDCQWVAPEGEPITLMQGEVLCDLDVTR